MVEVLYRVRWERLPRRDRVTLAELFWLIRNPAVALVETL